MFPSTVNLRTTLLTLLALTSIHPTTAIYTGDGTFYSPSVGFGSCGHLNQDSEHVAALATGSMTFYNPSNPNNNPVCGHKVKVWETSKPGKSVTVTIVDTCPGCHGKYDLDLSPSAFDLLDKPQVGRIKISWEFVEPFHPKTGPLAPSSAKAPVKKIAVGGKEVDSDAEEARDEL